MIGDSQHVRRVRLYEFGYVVPWDEIVERMESEIPDIQTTETAQDGGRDE